MKKNKETPKSSKPALATRTELVLRAQQSEQKCQQLKRAGLLLGETFVNESALRIVFSVAMLRCALDADIYRSFLDGVERVRRKRRMPVVGDTDEWFKNAMNANPLVPCPTCKECTCSASSPCMQCGTCLPTAEGVQ